jgi:hypothetical protein
LRQGWEGDQFGATNPKENAEHLDCNFNTYQTITDLPNGVYAVGCKAFYRAGNAQESNNHFRAKDRALRNACLYTTVGSETLTFPIVSPFSKSVTKAKGVGLEISAKQGTASYFIPDDMVAAEHYMHALDAYDNVIFAAVNDSTLTFGVRKDKSAGTDWCVFDDFTLTYYGDQPTAYKQWLTEMRKKKLSYTSVTVSKNYLDTYNNAFTATATNRDEAIAAMRAIDAAWEEIALNAELWAEYKQVGKEAEAMLNSDLYSEEAKSFLRTYYQSAYLANTASLALTNEELPEAIAELREYMDLVNTGEWTGISSVPSDNAQCSVFNVQYSVDGKKVSTMQQPGLYIIRSSNGIVRKILR